MHRGVVPPPRATTRPRCGLNALDAATSLRRGVGHSRTVAGWAAGTAAVALLAVVAVASRAPLTSAGGAVDRRALTVAALPLFALLGAAVVAGWAILALALRHSGPDADDPNAAAPLRAPLLVRLGVVLAAVAVTAGVAFAVLAISIGFQHPPRRAAPAGKKREARPADRAGRRADPGRDWAAAAFGIGLAAGAVGLVAMVVAERRRRQTVGALRPLPAARPQAVDDALEALADEPDPRRAIIMAYARMQATLARAGLGRRPSEAPREYLGRVMGGLGDGSRAARRLTALFERARFSPHAVDADMRQEAISALTALRDALARTDSMTTAAGG